MSSKQASGTVLHVTWVNSLTALGFVSWVVVRAHLTDVTTGALGDEGSQASWAWQPGGVGKLRTSVSLHRHETRQYPYFFLKGGKPRWTRAGRFALNLLTH